MISQALQKIVVATKDWNAIQGTLCAYQRTSIRESWQICLGPFDVVVGQNGLAWGRGLHRELADGPVKREGDGKSPAGIFSLSSCFGRLSKPTLQMDYFTITSTLEAVDDPRSRYYNQIVDRALISRPDWTSSEKMSEIDVYEWGVVVDHNHPDPVPGHGSAIFMHVWRSNREGTGGCTAMELSRMSQVCHWLDKKKHPILVQSPCCNFGEGNGFAAYFPGL